MQDQLKEVGFSFYRDFDGFKMNIYSQINKNSQILLKYSDLILRQLLYYASSIKDPNQIDFIFMIINKMLNQVIENMGQLLMDERQWIYEIIKDFFEQ